MIPLQSFTHRKLTSAFFCCLVLGGCGTQPKPPISGAEIAQIGERQKGSFLALIKLDSPSFTIEPGSTGCAAPDYHAQLTLLWRTNLQQALNASLEDVRIVETNLPVEGLVKDGKIAGLSFTLTTARNELSLTDKLFRTGVVKTLLQMVIDITWSDGSVKRQLVTASNSTAKTGNVCNDVAISDSSNAAMRDLLQQAVAHVKLLLARHRST